MRSTFVAVGINKLYRMYWFFIRPKTKGVKALVLYENKILLVRLTYYPNTWTFPGGKVEKNESTQDAVLRECKEEVDITLPTLTYVGELYFEHEYKKDIVSIYKSIVPNMYFKIDKKEVAEACWFDIKNLPTNIGKNALKIFEFGKI